MLTLPRSPWPQGREPLRRRQSWLLLPSGTDGPAATWRATVWRSGPALRGGGEWAAGRHRPAGPRRRGRRALAQHRRHRPLLPQVRRPRPCDPALGRCRGEPGRVSRSSLDTRWRRRRGPPVFHVQASASRTGRERDRRRSASSLRSFAAVDQHTVALAARARTGAPAARLGALSFLWAGLRPCLRWSPVSAHTRAVAGTS